MPKDKKNDTDDLDSMREQFRQSQQKRQGGGGENSWDKLDDGKNMRRILPRPGSPKFYTDGWTHFNVGPNERALRCIDEANIDVERGLPKSGSKCPSCKKFLREQSRINSEYKKGDTDGHAEWKIAKDKYVPRHQFYSNSLVPDGDDSFDVKILAYGPQVWGQLMNFFLGDDTDVGDFTNVESGRMMNIKKEKKPGRDKRNVEYKVYPKELMDISDSWDDIKEALHDLDAAAGKILSVDEFIAVMKGIDPDKDKKDDDDDDDDDDGSSDDSSSEEEEEEDKPVKKNSSKLSKRRGDD